MKNLLLLIAVLFSLTSYSQKDEVFAKFKEYKINEDILNHGIKDANATYSFNLKTTTTTKASTGETTETEECHFDPTQPVGSKWVLDTHNGKKASKKELKNFDKSHNTKDKEVDGQVDENSWKIVSDNENYFVVHFKYDEQSLPKKYSYLANCTATAYFNKANHGLEKIEFVNDGDLHIKFFKVKKLNMVIKYKMVDGQSLMENMDAEMLVLLLGQTIPLHEESIYSKYKKVL